MKHELMKKAGFTEPRIKHVLVLQYLISLIACCFPFSAAVIQLLRRKGKAGHADMRERIKVSFCAVCESLLVSWIIELQRSPSLISSEQATLC